MIITIDTEKIANAMLADGQWTIKDFQDNDAPSGWTNELVDLVPEYEDAVYKDVINQLEAKAFDLKGARAEAVKRLLANQETHPFADSLEWLDKQTIVTTRKAFELAKADKSVIQLFADGTDSQLDDLEAENEYFPDKSKSFPDIETIFLVENL